MLCFKHMNDTIYGFLKNAKLFLRKEKPRLRERKKRGHLGI